MDFKPGKPSPARECISSQFCSLLELSTGEFVLPQQVRGLQASHDCPASKNERKTMVFIGEGLAHLTHSFSLRWEIILRCVKYTGFSKN